MTSGHRHDHSGEMGKLVINGDDSTPDPRSGTDLTLASYDAAAERYIEESREPRGRLAQFLDAFASMLGAGTVSERSEPLS